MPTSKAQLDTVIRIVTPENIAFEYRVAGPFRRLGAYLIDVGLRIGMSIGIWLVLMFTLGSVGLGSVGVGVWLVAMFAFEWFYGGVFETVWNGQTPGKRICGLRVLTVDGLPIRAWQAVLRNFLRIADGMPLLQLGVFRIPLYQLGLFAAASNDRFQRLGDLACGTMVVIEERSRPQAMVRIVEPAALQLAADLPPKLAIDRGVARALGRYVERRQRFSWARRCEMAYHLAEPLRVKLDLPSATNPDVLLCALYHRIFTAEVAEEPSQPPPRPMVAALPGAITVPALAMDEPAPLEIDG
ncbi:MAG TPA: RDD family protein [Pirellulales bacterium]|nr:RDD family protein [Pirellulales bacterium]